MIRFRSTLPAETIARALAPAVYPHPDAAEIPFYVGEAPARWELSRANNHKLCMPKGDDVYAIGDRYRDPDRRARFLAVLAEIGAEVLP